MAEASSTSGNEEPDKKERVLENLECAVCLQSCIHPSELPCGHIFCFLCIKGMANQSRRCAMCRKEIPPDFIERPKLLQLPDVPDHSSDEYQWFYEGRNGWWKYDLRTSEDIENAYKQNMKVFESIICGHNYVIDLENLVQYPKHNPSKKRYIKRALDIEINVLGWWQYDERTSKELESCYKEGENVCELLIAGFLYVVDLKSMIQMRKSDPLRRRRVKRDLASIPKKGVAGLRTDTDFVSSSETQRSFSPVEGRLDYLEPYTPTNTPQTPISGQESPQADDLEATIERIRTLRLDINDNRTLYMLDNEEENP